MATSCFRSPIYVSSQRRPFSSLAGRVMVIRALETASAARKTPMVSRPRYADGS
jgi:hypothetical protein